MDSLTLFTNTSVWTGLASVTGDWDVVVPGWLNSGELKLIGLTVVVEGRLCSGELNRKLLRTRIVVGMRDL